MSLSMRRWQGCPRDKGLYGDTNWGSKRPFAEGRRKTVKHRYEFFIFIQFYGKKYECKI